MPRKYLPTLADLIDRLSIVQLKEVLGDGQYRVEHADEIQMILADLDGMPLPTNSPEAIRAIVVLALMNALIWSNEANAKNLQDTSGAFMRIRQLNGVRIRAKNKIEEFSGGRKDHKIDCISAEIPEWEPSW